MSPPRRCMPGIVDDAAVDHGDVRARPPRGPARCCGAASRRARSAPGARCSAPSSASARRGQQHHGVAAAHVVDVRRRRRRHPSRPPPRRAPPSFGTPRATRSSESTAPDRASRRTSVVPTDPVAPTTATRRSGRSASRASSWSSTIAAVYALPLVTPMSVRPRSVSAAGGDRRGERPEPDDPRTEPGRVVDRPTDARPALVRLASAGAWHRTARARRGRRAPGPGRTRDIAYDGSGSLRTAESSSPSGTRPSGRQMRARSSAIRARGWTRKANGTALLIGGSLGARGSWPASSVVGARPHGPHTLGMRRVPDTGLRVKGAVTSASVALRRVRRCAQPEAGSAGPCRWTGASRGPRSGGATGTSGKYSATQLGGRPLQHGVRGRDDERLEPGEVALEREPDRQRAVAGVDVAPQVPDAAARVVGERRERGVVGDVHDVGEPQADELERPGPSA